MSTRKLQDKIDRRRNVVDSLDRRSASRAQPSTSATIALDADAVAAEQVQQDELSTELVAEPLTDVSTACTSSQAIGTSRFYGQVHSAQTQGVPLVSQIAKQKGMVLKQSQEKRRRLLEVQQRLCQSDGTYARLRLSSSEIDDQSLEPVCRGLLHNRCVQYLELHDNRVTDSGAAALCLALRAHPCVRALLLGGNLLSDAAVAHIVQLLEHNPHVQEVNVSNRWPETRWSGSALSAHPRITAVGAAALAAHLSARPAHLVSLSLAHQRVADDGAVLLMRAIAHNRSLRTLVVKANQLTCRCCPHVAQTLLANTTLESLDLSCNSIGSAGCAGIASALAGNGTLRALALDHNLVGEPGVAALLLALESNFTLQVLTTFANPCADHRAETIVRMRAHAENSVVYSRSRAVFSATHRLAAQEEDAFALVSDQVFDSVKSAYLVEHEERVLALPSVPPLQAFGLRSPSRVLRSRFDQRVDRSPDPPDSRASLPLRPSSSLGRTPGIPYLGSVGGEPVRGKTGERNDSCAHLLYLRVSSPLDAEHERPTALLRVRLALCHVCRGSLVRVVDRRRPQTGEGAAQGAGRTHRGSS